MLLNEIKLIEKPSSQTFFVLHFWLSISCYLRAMVQNTKSFGNFFKKMPLWRPVASQPHTLWGLYEVQNNLLVSSFMHYFWSLRFDSWLQRYRGKRYFIPCFLPLNNTGFIRRVLHCLFLTDNEFHSLLSIPGYLKVPFLKPGHPIFQSWSRNHCFYHGKYLKHVKY